MIKKLFACRIRGQNVRVIVGYARASANVQGVAALVEALRATGTRRLSRRRRAAPKAAARSSRRAFDSRDIEDVLLGSAATRSSDLFDALAAITATDAHFRFDGDTRIVVLLVI
jgi:hypothetical protein